MIERIFVLLAIVAVYLVIRAMLIHVVVPAMGFGLAGRFDRIMATLLAVPFTIITVLLTIGAVGFVLYGFQQGP